MFTDERQAIRELAMRRIIKTRRLDTQMYNGSWGCVELGWFGVRVYRCAWLQSASLCSNGAYVQGY